MSVRSARNNNPGNIEANSTKWVGQSGVEPEGRFATFDTPAHGVRAMGRTLETYQNKHGLTTVADMINRWAPPNENNTSNYANFVAGQMGISPNQQIDLSENPALAQKMVQAMIKMEGGAEAEAYFAPHISDGLDMAYTNRQVAATQGTSFESYTEEELKNLSAAERYMLQNEIANKEFTDAKKLSQTEHYDEMVRDSIKRSGSLEELLDNLEDKQLFWDNELDNFQNYTYNLELFVVDQIEASRFLKYETTPNYVEDIVNDVWPDDSIKKITIAKTGVSTEMNITGLTIQTTGHGSTNQNKIAGTATNLQFTITQVGATSIPDTLQNAVLLCGYPDIPNAVYFMKVNFVGYQDDLGQTPMKLPVTKIFPFNIAKYNDLQTTTDNRGTTLLIEGTIYSDKVVTDTAQSIIDYNMEFTVADTLQETLENFFKKLNAKTVEKAIISDTDFINDYKFFFDENFKQRFAQGKMASEEANKASGNSKTKKKAKVKIAEQTGVVTPGTSIYDVIQSIIMNCVDVRKELTESKADFTSMFRVITHGQPKPGGYNVLSGKASYHIKYTIVLERALIYQNMIDNANKTKESAKILNTVFLKGHCRKRYYYSYTGQNDQILDLNISLDKQLQKVYSQPSDAFMANSFLKDIGDYRDKIDKKANDLLTKLEKETKSLEKELKEAQKDVKKTDKELKDNFDKIRSEFFRRLPKRGGGPLDERANTKSLYSNAEIRMLRKGNLKTFENILDEGTPEYDLFQDIFKGKTRKNYNELHNAVQASKKEFNETNLEFQETIRERDETHRAALDHYFSKKIAQATGSVSRNWDELGITAKGAGSGIVLAEDLDKDIIKKMSLSQFTDIMKTLLENPTNFERITKPLLSEPTKMQVVKSPDQKDVELAMLKYYEGLAANISMQRVNMTIKGDPFWIETYLSPAQAKDKFGEMNSDGTLKGHHSRINGGNYIVIASDKAEGVFLDNPDQVGQNANNNDGINKSRLITSVYFVKTIISNFDRGQFTQTLELVKLQAAEVFKEADRTILNVDDVDRWSGPPHFQYEIKPDRGTNEGKNDGAEDAKDIGVPIGAGSSQDDEGNITVVDTSAAVPSAVVAYKNAINVFIDAQGQNSGIPSEAQARQLALVTAQLHGLCEMGEQMACTELALGREQIVNHFGNADEARNIINQAIDGGDSVSPATIAMLDNAYEGRGEERIQDGVVNVPQNEIDGWNDAIQKEMDRDYLGNNDTTVNPSTAMSQLETGGKFGADGVNAVLNDDIQFSNKAFRNEKYSDVNGQFRSYAAKVEPGTLTTSEQNKARSLNNEAESIINGRPLSQLTDEEYARVKEIEETIEVMNIEATTGVRGEVRDEKEDEARRERIEKLQNEKEDLEDAQDSWYWTNKGREEDKARLEEVNKQLLAEELQEKGTEVETVQRRVDDNGFETFETLQKSKDPETQPVIIPRPEDMNSFREEGHAFTDNGDGTITVLSPKTNASADELPPEYSHLNETQRTQLVEARKAEEHFHQQITNAPTITKTGTVTNEDGSTETISWEVQDLSGIQDYTYTDENGQTQTISASSIGDTSNGYDSTVKSNIMNSIASNFDQIETGNPKYRRKDAFGDIQRETTDASTFSVKAGGN